MPATMTRKRKCGLPFKRLSKTAKEHAIEKQIEWLHQDFDADWVTEQLNDELHEHHGYRDLKVAGWSLGHCQGDGVDIEGDFDIGELAKTDEFVLECLAKGVLLGVCDMDDWDFSCSVKDGRVELEWQIYNSNDFADIRDSVDDIGLALKEHLQSILDDLKTELSRYGYDEIDYLTSEEEAIERIEANDHRFTCKGDYIR